MIVPSIVNSADWSWLERIIAAKSIIYNCKIQEYWVRFARDSFESMVNVTKSFLPDFSEYEKYLRRIWSSGHLTNNGPLALELEEKLKELLGVKHLLFTSNGTIVLQMALKVYGITKEVITTPFSYVATTNAILWEGCQPVFADINNVNFCIDSKKIEEKITENTQAILVTHVYGYPCDIDEIEKIADKYSLKVIYDAAHAFGCTYKGKSLLSFGDISTCSFHATKLFHTVEGGCIISNDGAIAEKLRLFRQFGHVGDEYFSMGINAKNSEFHAAMGLCILPHLNQLIESRMKVSAIYDDRLKGIKLRRPTSTEQLTYNYAYYPVIFKSEQVLLQVRAAMMHQGINPRRYFYPSLNQLKFVTYREMSLSEDISKRVLSLPLYPDLAGDDVDRICEIIISNVGVK